MSFSPPELLTVAETAQALKQSRSSVYRKIRAGELEAFHLGSDAGPLRIPAEAVGAYLTGAADGSSSSARAAGPAVAGARRRTSA